MGVFVRRTRTTKGHTERTKNHVRTCPCGRDQHQQVTKFRSTPMQSILAHLATTMPPKKKQMMQETTKYKKNPMAPKRFKSAFMFYSAKRHQELRKDPANKKVSLESPKKGVEVPHKNHFLCQGDIASIASLTQVSYCYIWLPSRTSTAQSIGSGQNGIAILEILAR